MRTLSFFLVALSLAQVLRAETKTLLAAETPGPTVLVITDPVANDITPDVALKQVATWSLAKGKLLVAPVAEMDAAIRSTRPDALLILRSTRARIEAASLAARGKIDAEQMRTTLNGLVDEGGDSVGVADDSTLPAGVPNAARLSVVIKNAGTVPAARTRLFRHAVHTVLLANGMTTSDPWTLIANDPKTIDVALYAGIGSNSSPGVSTFPRLFDADPGVRFTYVGPAELRRPGAMKQFDVVFFCGGLSHTQGRQLGADGAAAVRAFVKGGGGYVGTCAGSYLATGSFDWSLNLISADVIDYKHWLRGTGPVDVELTAEGGEVLGDYRGMLPIKYANGPLLAPTTRPTELPAYQTLAHFRGDMAKSAPGGVMPGTPAVIAAPFGDGRVVCFSPHPEYSPGYEGLIGNALRWVVKQPMATTQATAPSSGTPGEGRGEGMQ